MENMRKCDPKNCYELNERIAIMQFDGNVRGNLLTKAVSCACKTCAYRDKRGDQIIKELTEKEKNERPDNKDS